MKTKRITLFIIFLSINLSLFSQKELINITRVVPYFGEKAFHISYNTASEYLNYKYAMSYRLNKGSWSQWIRISNFSFTFQVPVESSILYEFRIMGSDSTGKEITSNINGNSFARVWPVYDCYGAEMKDLLCAYNQPLKAGDKIYLHNGIDVGTRTMSANHIVKAPVGGEVVAIQKDSILGGLVCILQYEKNGGKYITLGHLQNMSEYVSLHQIVKPNDIVGNIAPLEEAYGQFIHVHISYTDAVDKKLEFDPLTIWEDTINRDPLGVGPTLFDAHNRGPIRFKKGPHSIKPEDYLNSRNLIFGPIDIIVQATDKQSVFFNQVPFKIGYSIFRFERDQEIVAVKRYTLINNYNWFGDSPTSALPSTMEALVDTHVEPVTEFGEYGDYSIWPLWFTYIVTNATNKDGLATASDLDINQCWRTDAVKGNEGENGYKNATAKYNEETQFPDGAYNINIYLADLVHFPPPFTHKVIVDNFRPYIKEVIITETGGNVLYKAKWDFNDGILYYTKEAENPTNGNKDISIRAILSEDMEAVTMSIPSLNIGSKNLEYKNDYWCCTITADRLKNFKCGKLQAFLMFWGTDLASNPLEGFENTNPSGNIPKRIGENARDWAPSPQEKLDQVHFFKIESDPNDKDCKQDPPPPPPPPPFTITVVRSKDPNDIKGPDGYGCSKWVSVIDVLPYTIQFENDPKLATAAVNKVVVTHPIDSKANMFSFRLGAITFRNITLQVPPNTSYFFKRLNLADSIGVNVDITAGLDVTKKQAFWIFQAFDPVTGLPNLNPHLGFLPINDSITHQGEGSVSFSIKPKITDKTGDTIKAFADIVFDVNDNLRTNTTFNTIDALSPVSKLKAVTSLSADNIKASWTGHDDTGGCGIAGYNLLISENGGPYSSYATGIADTTLILNLNSGNKYKIQTIAADYAGNTESFKPEADTTIEILPASFFISPSYASKSCAGSRFTIKWQNINNISAISLQVSADSGKTYTTIGEQIPVMDSVFIWNIPTSYIGNQYYKIRALNSVNQLPLSISDYFLIRNSIHVNAGIDRELCPESKTTLGGLPTASNGIAPYTYQWSLSAGLSSDTISNPMAFMGGDYVVCATDSIGCSNNDTIQITSHQLPDVYAYGLDTAYDVNAAKVKLHGSPAGGIFSGKGITGDIFDPFAAQVGLRTITYTYRNEYGCPKHTTNNTKILPVIMGLDTAYCYNTPADTLTRISAGGLFSGNGMVDNVFYPSLAGEGMHEIKYTYTDSTETTFVAFAKTKVYPFTLVSFTGLDPVYCINADTVALSGIPSGGGFSGSGIVDNKFIPALAGTGAHQITYSYLGINQKKSTVINNVPFVNLSNNNSSFCAGTTLALHAEQGLKNYLWNTGATSQTIIIKTGGNYTVTVTDNNNCQGKDSIEISVFSNPHVSLGKDITIHPNDSILLIPQPKGFSKYLWNDSSINENLLVKGKNLEIGMHPFWVLVTDQNNCSNSDTINMMVLSPDYINLNNADNTTIAIYPNPTDRFLNLKIENIFSGDLTIELINMKGIIALVRKYNSNAKIITDQFDLSNLASGSYVLKIIYGDIVKSETIIKGSNP